MSTIGSHAGGADRTVRDDVEAIRSDLNALKGDLRNLASDSAVAGRHVARQARERISEVAGQVGEKARAAYGVAKDKGREATEAIEHKIEDHPFAAVGIAFGVGLLLGAIIARR